MTTIRPEAAAELKRIAKASGGMLQPEVVVDCAKKKDSPLHEYFTWDDTEAAREYRLWQARSIIRVVVDVVPHTEIETRAFVSLQSDRNADRGYRGIVSVMSDADLQAELLEQARSDMTRFRLKYRILKELAGVFEAMDKVK